ESEPAVGVGHDLVRPLVHPSSPETNQRPTLTPIKPRFINEVWESARRKRLTKPFYDIKNAPEDERSLNLFGQQSGPGPVFTRRS
ncbi:hypothetical protein CDAR_613781, partial [Caerostris darwini]